MYSRIDPREECYECRKGLGQERPIKTLVTDHGAIRMCNRCAVDLEKNVLKVDGAYMLRKCRRCDTIIAEDYQPCYVLENPEEEFWLCITCDEITDKEIAEDKNK
jgi:hypothetical protein